MTAATCPACDGDHLYSLTYRHTNACALRAQDDARRAADAELLVGTDEFTRRATDAELTLAAAVGWTGPTAQTTARPGTRC